MGSALGGRRRRAMSALVFCLLTAALVGCGHGSHHHHHASGGVTVSPPPVGTLEVFNVASSRDAIGSIELDRDPGSPVLHHVFVPQDSSAFFDLVPGSYDVTTFWDGGGHDTFFNIGVFSDRTTTLSVRF